MARCLNHPTVGGFTSVLTLSAVVHILMATDGELTFSSHRWGTHTLLPQVEGSHSLVTDLRPDFPDLRWGAGASTTGSTTASLSCPCQR